MFHYSHNFSPVVIGDGWTISPAVTDLLLSAIFQKEFILKDNDKKKAKPASDPLTRVY